MTRMGRPPRPPRERIRPRSWACSDAMHEALLEAAAQRGVTYSEVLREAAAMLLSGDSAR